MAVAEAEAEAEREGGRAPHVGVPGGRVGVSVARQRMGMASSGWRRLSGAQHMQ